MNAQDAQDVIMQCEAEFQGWLRDAQKDWDEPLMKNALLMIWSQLPPEARSYLQQQDPKQYKEIERFLRGE